MNGQTFASVRFDVTDQDGNITGQITPADPGDLSCRDGVRTIRGWRLFPDAGFDPYADRIVPVWVASDTTGNVEYPLGTFVAVGGTETWVQYQAPDGTSTEGYVSDWDLQDLTARLDVPLLTSVGLNQGGLPTALIEQLLADAGFLVTDIANFSVGVAEPASWEAGSDSSLSAILDMVASAGGRFWIDREGVPTATVVPAPADTPVDRTYDTGTGDVLDPPSYTTNPFATNLWQAVGGTDTAPIVGTYSLPADAPGSYASRGFQIVERFDVAATDQTSADAAAQAAAVDAVRSDQTVTFTAPVEPTMEPYECLSIDGALWVVSDFGWSLRGDAVMDVTAGRIWT